MKLIFDSARFGEFNYKGFNSVPGAEQRLLAGLIVSALTPFLLSRRAGGFAFVACITWYFCIDKLYQDITICDLEQKEKIMKVNFEYAKKDDCFLYEKINRLRDELTNFTALVDNTKALRIFFD